MDMNKPLPLTVGLIVSAAIRFDHSFTIGNMLSNKSLHDHQCGILDDLIVAIMASNPQVMEELTGRGFYRPDRETQYSEMVDSDITQYIKAIIAEINEQMEENQ